MRIVRFLADVQESPEQARWGLLVDDLVYPLARAPYESPRLNRGFAPEIDGPPHLCSQVRLVAPVVPRKIVCVGRNYAAHAEERGHRPPPEPLLFLKPPSAVIGPGEPVVLPSVSQRVDHEAELAVVIGKRCRYVNPQDAWNVVLGYTCANDVTARDLQDRDGQWARAKGFDTFCPVGPWIDTRFEPSRRTIRCLVNDELRQEGTTDQMVFPIPSLLAHISNCMTLEPGDLVLTGTPAGVGPLRPGDTVTVDVEGLGALANPVMAGI